MISAQFKEQVKMRSVFVPRRTKEDLALWIAEYLGLEFPDAIVDEDSTTTPMEYIWQMYKKALTGEDPEQGRTLAFASRDSYKTLGTAVIEFLMLVHLNRDVGHMAAIEKQAKQATSYIQNFLSRPYFKKFVLGDNQRTKEFVRYENDSGDNLSAKEYEALPLVEQANYRVYRTKLDIVICTKTGANSLHVPTFVVDEVDLANAEAYEEAKMIPTSTEEKPAMTILTSTRKYAFGLVQDEIDRAHKTGLKVLHWNILDIAKKCEPSRHLPHLPMVETWVDKESMAMASAEEYARLTEDQKENYVRKDAFAGCLKNCSLFKVCQGRLATHQKGPKYPQAVNLQKPIEHLITQFKAVSPEMVKAQLLCRKPSQSGLVYPFLDRDVHMKTPAEIAEKVLGTPVPEDMTKEGLIEFFRNRGARFVSGMDFGYTHNWATNLVAIDGRRAFVLGSLAQAEILTNQQIELFQSAWGHIQPEVYADPENPQGVKEFKDAGCNMRKWTKGPGSVLAGIEVVRWMIRPLLGEPLLYFLSGDPDVDFLFTRMSQYHWKMNAAGRPTDVPDDTNDDECDAIRYALMNEFSKGKTSVKDQDIPRQETLREAAARVHRAQVMEHVGADVFQKPQQTIVRKGRFFIAP